MVDKRAGRRGRGNLSPALGARDPRLSRNARSEASGAGLDDSLELSDGRQRVRLRGGTSIRRTRDGLDIDHDGSLEQVNGVLRVRRPGLIPPRILGKITRVQTGFDAGSNFSRDGILGDTGNNTANQNFEELSFRLNQVIDALRALTGREV